VYEKSLNEAELILRRERERLLPVRSVWEEVVKRSKLAGFEVAALADFSAMLEGDRRFQIIPARVEGEEPGEEPQAGDGLDDAEMEQLGFFPEDRVRLVTPSVVQEEPGEENEEIGSIRRRAFINQPENRGKTADRKAATVSLVPKKRADRKNKKTGKRALKTFQRKKRGPALRARKSKMRTRKKK
jgi:hypothetical protein